MKAEKRTYNLGAALRIGTFGALLLTIASLSMFAQTGSDGWTTSTGQRLTPDMPLPTDPAVTVGTLPNGLRYYIRRNTKPEGRAELRLAVRAGSVLEDDDQRGFAHFVEHMAFNGTKNFAKNDMVTFLESIGMRFGADLNAFTSFDQTVYMLQVPTDDATSLGKGMLILEDWASGILFEEDAIEAERGVVIEELRARRGGDSRIGDIHFAAQYDGSKYADRLPIGTKESLEEGSSESMRRFYKDWYRPDMMAVVAVGDFDVAAVEKMIRTGFSDIPAVKNPRPSPDLSIPINDEPRVVLAFDPEVTNATVQLMIRHGKVGRETVGDYRRSILEGIAGAIVNGRLDELRRSATPPFLYAAVGAGIGLGDYHQMQATVVVNNGQYVEGFRSLMTELERVRRYGVTAAELERQKSAVLANIDQYYAEKDKTESGSYAREYYSNFTTGEAFPGIAYERELYHTFVPAFTVEDVNRAINEMMTEKGRSIAVGGPEVEGVDDLEDDDFTDVMEDVMTAEIEPYAEEVVTGTLLPREPTPGTIVSTRRIEEIGVVEWTLSNGARVVLKPTDFQNDEILMNAYSPGGTSLVSDAEYLSAANASAIIGSGGVGPFDASTLRKYLTGKVANVSASVGQLTENLQGFSSVNDVETMFQLIHARFTAPRKDTNAYQAYLSQLRNVLMNQGSDPESVFRDSVSYISSGYHPRSRPFTTAMVDDLDLETAYSFYRNRFADASDFTFFFVGTIDEAMMKPLVEKYVASLPSTKRTETWKDVGMRTPSGTLTREIMKGIEPKSLVQLYYHGDFDWSAENRVKLRAMVEVFQMKLRETLREEKGGVYSPGAYGSYEHYPESQYEIVVYFSCDPERVDELIAAVDSIAKEMSTTMVDQSYIDNVKEIVRRERETSLKDNGNWAASLQYYYMNDEDPRTIIQMNDMYQKLTTRQSVLEQAKRYFDTKNRMLFVLKPEVSN